MTSPPSIITDLLAECDSQGIHLTLAGDDKLTIDAPKNSLTPNLLERLKANKIDVLATLTARDVPLALPYAMKEERAAIQWAESGPAGDVDAAFNRAIHEWGELTGLADKPVIPSLADAPPHEPAVADVPRRRPDKALRTARRLTGNGFAPIPTTIPPPSIWATPKVVCQRCGIRPVLPELRTMTGGQCWDCWAGSNRSGSHDGHRS